MHAMTKKIKRKRRKHSAARRRRVQSDEEAGLQRALNALSRIRMRQLWEQAQRGEMFEGEEGRMVQAMRDHPEYAALWPRLDELSNAELEQDGVNPVMHIMIHSTLEGQLAENTPPVTEEVLAALMAQGLSRHEALHRMGGPLADEIYGVLKEQRTFDAAGYERKMRQLISGED
jgi:hypothetical protein